MVDRLVNSEVNARRIANIEACFGGSGQHLAIYGRVLVGEGVLIKLCRKKPKPRQFFLFNDILIYGNILISKKRYNKQHVIPLEEVQLENLTDDGESKNGWLIKTRTKSFAVFAATATEKKEWMLHIQRCVHELLAKGGKTAATEHAAVWVPDSDAVRCMCCDKVEFNAFLQRRHHCRKCGNVVCQNCSSHKFRLDVVSRRPVRVCNECFDKLTSAGCSLSAEQQPSSNNAADARNQKHHGGRSNKHHHQHNEATDNQESSADDYSDDEDADKLDEKYDHAPTFYQSTTAPPDKNNIASSTNAATATVMTHSTL